jgi:pyruvate/2-oxoglutarate dehydrogenase complex dihydrolipoamide acyltransferase (E2) component
MARAFKLPDLGEGLTEGEIARWLVTEGQVVAEDEPLVEIQTDKATVEIPSPYGGTVLRILVPEGEVAPVGASLVVIGEPGEAVDEPTPQPPSSSEPQGAAAAPASRPERAQATPLVRRIAA